MPRYNLRSLLILLAVGPPLVAISLYGIIAARDAARAAKERVERLSEIHSAAGGLVTISGN